MNEEVTTLDEMLQKYRNLDNSGILNAEYLNRFLVDFTQVTSNVSGEFKLSAEVMKYIIDGKKSAHFRVLWDMNRSELKEFAIRTIEKLNDAYSGKYDAGGWEIELDPNARPSEPFQPYTETSVDPEIQKLTELRNAYKACEALINRFTMDAEYERLIPELKSRLNHLFKEQLPYIRRLKARGVDITTVKQEAHIWSAISRLADAVAALQSAR